MDFLHNAQTALTQVIMLYVMVAIGVIGDRLGWFTSSIAQTCTKLLFFIVTPCVMLRSFFSLENTPQTLRGFAIAVFCGIVMHIVGILLSEPFFRNRSANGSESVLHFASIYGNCGYMALPLAQALAGTEGVFYGSAIILTFQIFSFTHGEYVMSGGIPFQKHGKDGIVVNFQPKSLLLNAGVLSVLVGLPLFLLRVNVPAALTSPINSIAAMNSPLAMLIFGAHLSHTKLGSVFQNKKIIATIVIKLFAVPACILLVFRLFHAQGDALVTAVLISASAPSANNTVVFAAKHGRDAGYAAQAVAVVSFLSVLTMPCVIALGRLGGTA
ncbi:MAG: AEC family transporter [Oscillospiraceae bacterium]|jgi:predicted permease|nr:AEC family transporter [Oscillospiraceae bacterium]